MAPQEVLGGMTRRRGHTRGMPAFLRPGSPLEVKGSMYSILLRNLLYSQESCKPWKLEEGRSGSVAICKALPSATDPKTSEEKQK